MIEYLDEIAGVRASQLDGGFFEGWPSPPSASEHLEILRGSAAVALAVDRASDDRVVGFVTAISDGLLSASIPLLEVLPSYRGRGIGRSLMRRMLSRLAPLYMIDLTCDEALRPFYASLGMQPLRAMVIRNRG